MFEGLGKEIDKVYQGLKDDKSYREALTACERALASLNVRYGTDGQDLLLPEVAQELGLSKAPFSVKIRTRASAIELSSLVTEDPSDDLLAEIFWYWAKHPDVAVYFGITPLDRPKDDLGDYGLGVFSRLPLPEGQVRSPKVLAPLLGSAIAQMHLACQKLAAGDFGQTGKELLSAKSS